MRQLLYVEDSAMAQALMRKYLFDIGELTILSTLTEAIELVRVKLFDLIILDFSFPEGDSIGLIEEIRTLHSAIRLPILVVSATVDRTLLARLLRAGANDALTKPVVTDVLRALVKRLLQQPYTRPIETTTELVTCFEWQANGIYHQYCPVLNMGTNAPSRLEAAERMKTLLNEYMEKGTRFNVVSRGALAMHLVDRLPEAAGDPPLASRSGYDDVETPDDY